MAHREISLRENVEIQFMRMQFSVNFELDEHG